MIGGIQVKMYDLTAGSHRPEDATFINDKVKSVSKSQQQIEVYQKRINLLKEKLWDMGKEHPDFCVQMDKIDGYLDYAQALELFLQATDLQDRIAAVAKKTETTSLDELTRQTSKLSTTIATIKRYMLQLEDYPALIKLAKQLQDRIQELDEVRVTRVCRVEQDERDRDY